MGLSLLGLWIIAAQRFVAPVGHDDDAAVRAIVEWADVARRLLTAPTVREAIGALSSYFQKVTKLGPMRLSSVFDLHIGVASMPTCPRAAALEQALDRKSTRLNSSH